MKLVKRLISKLWMNRGVQARWWGEESKERKRAEGLSEEPCRGETGEGLGIAQLWAAHGTRVGHGPPLAGCQKSTRPIGKP